MQAMHGAPVRILPAGSALDKFVEIVWCWEHRRRAAAPPRWSPAEITHRVILLWDLPE